MPYSVIALLSLLHLCCSGVGSHDDGDLRLFSYTRSPGGGRLEVYHRNNWTPFCVSDFDMHNADLACKKMGYLYAYKYATVASMSYRQTRSDSSISSLQCPSYENSFRLCNFSTTADCPQSSYVGLICSYYRTSVRLMSNFGYSSLDISSGRLEVHVNGTWGTVSHKNFDRREATVACNQLGFPDYRSYEKTGNRFWLMSILFSTPVWLNDLNCSSSSSDIRQCADAVGCQNCIHGEDVLLTCEKDFTRSSRGLSLRWTSGTIILPLLNLIESLIIYLGSTIKPFLVHNNL